MSKKEHKFSEKLKGTIKLNKKDFMKFLIFSVIVVIMIVATVFIFPYVISLKDEAGRTALKNFISSKGIWGIGILLLIQIGQVVFAIIPGEPVEIIAGLLYGTFGGFFICTIGTVIGTIIIFSLVRLLGASFLNEMISEEKIKKFKFLNEVDKLQTVIFILFFIPGTPKDLLTYFVPLTKIKMLPFLLIVTIARIPSVISSTFAGASIGEGKWVQSIIVFVITGIIGIVGIKLNSIYVKRVKNKKSEK